MIDRNPTNIKPFSNIPIDQYQKKKLSKLLILTWCLGRPTIDGNTALGALSPANPALHIPDPLSTTKAATSSSHMIGFWLAVIKAENYNKQVLDFYMIEVLGSQIC